MESNFKFYDFRLVKKKKRKRNPAKTKSRRDILCGYWLVAECGADYIYRAPKKKNGGKMAESQNLISPDFCCHYHCHS